MPPLAAPEADQYRLLFDRNPHPMWVFDRETLRFLAVNDATVAAYGFSREELLANTIMHIRPPDEVEAIHAYYLVNDLGEGPITVPGAFHHRRRDGSIFDVEVVASRLVFDGRSAVLVLATDISERRRNEAALAGHTQTLRHLAAISLKLNASHSVDEVLHAVTEGARTIIGAHQAVSTSVTLNQAWAQGTNSVSLSDKYAAWRAYAEKPTGSGIYRLIAETNRPMRLTQAALEAHPAWQGFGAAAGRHPPMRGWLAAPLTDTDGHTVGMIQLSDKYDGDFTEEDEAIAVQLAQIASVAIANVRLFDAAREHAGALEARVAERTAELAAMNEELEAFSYSVSHDLRAPLRSIDGFAAVLMEDVAPLLDAGARHSLERVRAGAKRMGLLIDALLGLSRVSRGEMHRTTCDLSAMAEAIAAELRKRDPARAVVFDIAPGIAARGDVNLLRALLENLLGNAWKYTGKTSPARIHFGCVERGGRRTYVVRDNGAGFDMAYADKLFQPFQRLHDAREFEGTGVGLATVQRIVTRHGGRIWAQGAPEHGAAFFFTLPQLVPTAAQAAGGA